MKKLKDAYKSLRIWIVVTLVLLLLLSLSVTPCFAGLVWSG